MLKKTMGLISPMVLAFALTVTSSVVPAQDKGLSGGHEIGMYCLDFGFLAQQTAAARQLGMTRAATTKHINALLATRPTPPVPALGLRLDQVLEEAFAVERMMTEYDAGLEAFAFGVYFENVCLNNFKGF